MAKMKKFLIYFLIFISMYIFIQFSTNFLMKERFVDITNHEISINSPKINITESKASEYSGYIKGNITNDTGEHIRNKYLQFDFYNKDGVYLGTESYEIKYFNVNEKLNFEIRYSYKNTNKIKINFVNEVTKPKVNNNNIINLNDNEKKLAISIALILGLYTILP